MEYPKEEFAPVTAEQILHTDWGKKPIVYYMLAVWLSIFAGSMIYLACLTYISLMTALCSIVLPLAAIILSVMLIRRKVGTEYEYEFVAGTFTVSKVICRSSRETLCDFSCDDVLVMAPLSGTHLKELDQAEAKHSVNAVPGDITRGRWFILYTKGRTKFRVLLAPNQEILDAFARTLPKEKFFEM